MVSVFILFSCKNRDINYISYYNKANKIDSIYRFKKDTLVAIKKYKKLFRKYPPKNQERLREYETYITNSDKFHKNFGGKKSLDKLIFLLAPYEDKNQEYFKLYQKYGIDSIQVKKKITEWKKNLNKRLIDSFTVAMIRDQEKRHIDHILQKKNVEKNANFLMWTFKNYGFPSLQKIGNTGNDNVFIAMTTLLTHMIESEHYPYFKTKLLEYVKSGDCMPRDYAMMVDSFDPRVATYGYGIAPIKDSIQVNRNRKSIGLPSLQHGKQITKDFLKKK